MIYDSLIFFKNGVIINYKGTFNINFSSLNIYFFFFKYENVPNQFFFFVIYDTFYIMIR